MTIYKLIGAFALASLGVAGHAQAQSTPGSVTLGITGGTEGVGPEISYRASSIVGVRANATFLGFGHGVTSDGIRYSGHADLDSGGAMIDLYPFRGGFFVSAGGRINGNHGTVTATPTQNTQIGGFSFTPAQIGTITGRGDTRKFAPQVTLGYHGALGSHVMLGLEAGALFQGAVRINEFTSNGVLANDATYIAHLAQERQSVQHTVDGYQVYPVAQIRLGYRF